jgi:Type IX secretion system protein PorV
MSKKLAVILTSIALTMPFLTKAQTPTNSFRVVNAAVPFLTISPDSRGAALGDAGVASAPDANAIYWNTAKLAYIDKSIGGSFSYAPWLRDLTNDMGLLNASFFKKVGKSQALTANLNYFNQGLIQFTTNTGASAGDFQSREFAITVGYATKLAQDFSMGVNMKYINSNLIGTQVVNNQASKPGSTVAGDISFFYKKDRPTANVERGVSPSFGLVFQNIGGKINYGRDFEYFIPANLKIGTNINIRPDLHNSFNILVDFNKLLVPTPTADGKIPDIGSMNAIFSSFNDAPDGFKEEMREVMTSFGLEYNYDNLLAIRGGYFFEAQSKGGRKYVTTGLGLRLRDSYSLDLAYLIPTASGSPLANTWRISLLFDLKNKKLAAVEDDVEMIEK